METKSVRTTKVLLPSEDEPAVTRWPYDASLNGEKISNTEFRNVNLALNRWGKITLNRCRFADSKLTGLALAEGSLADVLFEECDLDYAVFKNARFTGSVAFIGCTLRGAVFDTADISGAAFDRCVLDGLELISTRMRDTDLRGNDISQVTGLTSLRGARLEESQLRDLIGIVTRSLDLVIE